MLYKGTLQIVPNPINTYKYMTGLRKKWGKGWGGEGERGKG